MAEDKINFFAEVWTQKLKDFLQEYKPDSYISKNKEIEEHKFIFY